MMLPWCIKVIKQINCFDKRYLDLFTYTATLNYDKNKVRPCQTLLLKERVTGLYNGFLLSPLHVQTAIPRAESPCLSLDCHSN